MATTLPSVANYLDLLQCRGNVVAISRCDHVSSGAPCEWALRLHCEKPISQGGGTQRVQYWQCVMLLASFSHDTGDYSDVKIYGVAYTDAYFLWGASYLEILKCKCLNPRYGLYSFFQKVWVVAFHLVISSLRTIWISEFYLWSLLCHPEVQYWLAIK